MIGQADIAEYKYAENIVDGVGVGKFEKHLKQMHETIKRLNVVSRNSKELKDNCCKLKLTFYYFRGF